MAARRGQPTYPEPNEDDLEQMIVAELDRLRPNLREELDSRSQILFDMMVDGGDTMAGAIFDVYDEEGDGNVTEAQFCKLLVDFLRMVLSSGRLQDVNEHDPDAQKINNLIHKVNDWGPKLRREFDKNNDGQVDRDEFASEIFNKLEPLMALEDF